MRSIKLILSVELFFFQGMTRRVFYVRVQEGFSCFKIEQYIFIDVLRLEKLLNSTMGWKGVFVYLLNLASLGESTSRSTQFRPISLSTASSSLYSWAVCIAAIVVVVAFVLSMYLNFVHLAAYNQPEVCVDILS